MEKRFLKRFLAITLILSLNISCLIGVKAWAKTRWENIGGAWYYYDEDGKIAVGWKKIGNCNKWYYFNPGGDMVVGWKYYNGQWYYFNEDGDMKYNSWRKINGNWYFFKINGAMAHDEWAGYFYHAVWQGDFYLTSDGKMATNTWIGNCYVGADGKWIPEPTPGRKTEAQAKAKFKELGFLTLPDRPDGNQFWEDSGIANPIGADVVIGFNERHIIFALLGGNEKCYKAVHDAFVFLSPSKGEYIYNTVLKAFKNQIIYVDGFRIELNQASDGVIVNFYYNN